MLYKYQVISNQYKNEIESKKKDILKSILGKLTHGNCCKEVDQTVIAKWPEIEMNRTVFKFFCPELQIFQYPIQKTISKEQLGKFLNHSLIKKSYKYIKSFNSSKKYKKTGKEILLSMRNSIDLTLSTRIMRLSFRPIFKDKDNENWFPLL